MANIEQDYKTYIKKAEDLYQKLKGNASGEVGLKVHIEVLEEVCSILEQILEDWEEIEAQYERSEQILDTNQTYFEYFLDREKTVIIKSGSSAEFAQQWMENAKKLVSIEQLTGTDRTNLKLILERMSDYYRDLLGGLKEGQTLEKKKRKLILRATYGLACLGIYSANSIVLPSLFPITIPSGIMLSQEIAMLTLGAAIPVLPGLREAED